MLPGIIRGIKGKRPQRGQGLVEFMLVLPVLLLVTMGIVEFARMFAIYTMISSASREAARYGASVGDNGFGTPKYLDCAGIRDAARRVAIFSQLDDTDIQVRYDEGTTATVIATCDSGPAEGDIELGDRVVVTVNATYSPIVPLLPMIPTQTLTSSTARTILKEIDAGPTATLGGPVATSTPSNTPNPAFSPTASPTASATPTASNTPTAGPSPTPLPTNTPVPTATPIPAPQNFSATATCNNGRVSFNWDSMPDVDYYAVYRIDPPPTTMIVIDSNPPCNNCDLLGGDTTRTYVAVAVVNGVESSYSNASTVNCP